MKKYLLIATAFVALASCSDDTFVGENSPNTNDNYGDAIVFRSSAKRATRTDHVGADAADMLGGKFYVGGFKNNGSAYSTVFDNYLVSWEVNSAGKTTDNTSDWKYVGLKALDYEGHVGHTTTSDQTLKYWDFAASYYDFVAFSAGKNQSIITSGTPTSDQIKATAIAPTTLISAAYTLEGSATDLAECYIADLITAKKSGATSPDVNYQSEVPFKFRRLGSKVRIALYETVPGYSVRNVEFYTDNSTAIDANISSSTKATLFTGSGDKKFYPNGTMTVKFPTIGSSNRSKTDYNKAHVSFVGSGTAVATKDFEALNYEEVPANWEDPRLNYTGNEYKYLKRTAADPSFAGTSSPYYIDVLPDENGNVLELRVNYTLESIDGSKEAITIHGAKAFVPQVYAEWKPNYAYTYLFKISDNTNGWTSTTDSDPAGLYPITFDAVVADSEDGNQSTITTVSSPSITTYQKGHDISKDEYLAATGDIYVQVMADGTLKADLDSKGKLYTVNWGSTNASHSEASIMDALNIGTVSGTTVTGRNGITLSDATTSASVDATITEIPGPDGNNITVTTKTAAKFTPTANTVYAYVYDATPSPAPASTYIYTAETLTSSPGDWSTSGVWYEDPNGVTPVGTYANGTYYKKWENKNKVYGVKIIKIAAAS